MHPLVELAKSTVENYIEKKEIISPPEDLPQEFLTKKAGIFITLKKESKLRACIGTYLPTKGNIAQEVIRNAIAAATEDYRFGTIRKDEFPSLSYAVYILGEPELVRDTKELDPQKYGVLVKTDPLSRTGEADVIFNGRFPYKSGLLLPGLEEIITPEQQIIIACQKGGIDQDKEKILIYRFTVEKYDK
jgi:AmmeMemoRadiSam system protein A